MSDSARCGSLESAIRSRRLSDGSAGVKKRFRRDSGDRSWKNCRMDSRSEAVDLANRGDGSIAQHEPRAVDLVAGRKRGRNRPSVRHERSRPADRA